MIKIQLDKRFKKQAKGIYEKYSFEVGILKDRPHNQAKDKSAGLSSYAGGPVRKKSQRSSQKVSDVSEALRKHTGINFYTSPFTSKQNKDILAFTKVFFDLAFGRSEKRRAENMLQAIVRNPILRGDYGRNKSVTAKIKGFNRFMIDTAQLFRNITARVVKRV